MSSFCLVFKEASGPQLSESATEITNYSMNRKKKNTKKITYKIEYW